MSFEIKKVPYLWGQTLESICLEIIDEINMGEGKTLERLGNYIYRLSERTESLERKLKTYQLSETFKQID